MVSDISRMVTDRIYPTQIQFSNPVFWGQPRSTAVMDFWVCADLNSFLFFPKSNSLKNHGDRKYQQQDDENESRVVAIHFFPLISAAVPTLTDVSGDSTDGISRMVTNQNYPIQIPFSIPETEKDPKRVLVNPTGMVVIIARMGPGTIFPCRVVKS
jgi:hypothetical protein